MSRKTPSLKLKKLPTCLVGFGRIAQGYSKDKRTAKHFLFATHAQVLKKHPNFDWVAVIDKNEKALSEAKKKWKIKVAEKNPKDLKKLLKKIKIVVLATPPENRLKILKLFPNCRGVLVEKPLGTNIRSAKKFVDYCHKKKIMAQVNFWRRADTQMQRFAKNKMKPFIGEVQGIFCLYGNGIKNNAIHLIDLLRMVFGDVSSENSRIRSLSWTDSPIQNDQNLSFILNLSNNTNAVFIPVNYRYFRENSLEIYGTKGKLEIKNEGLVINHFKIAPHRSLSGSMEIKCDKPIKIKSTAGDSLYRLYSNLASSIRAKKALWSSCNSALKSEMIAHKLCKNIKNKYRRSY